MSHLTLQTEECSGGIRHGHAVGEVVGTQLLLCQLLKRALQGPQQFEEETLGRQRPLMFQRRQLSPKKEVTGSRLDMS